MQDINTRGTFRRHPRLYPAPEAGDEPHILTLSPPISLEPRWLGPHVAYTVAKYGMSLCALGLAAEFRDAGIGSNALWPRTVIAAAARRTRSAPTTRRPPRAGRRCTRTPPTR
jgi:citronellol/citronellal dehydrogenase